MTVSGIAQMNTLEKPVDASGNAGRLPLDGESTRYALDQLFRLTQRYSSTENYADLLSFMRRFRFYAPYNAMLVHIQMPGARYVAAPHRWLDKYRHRIKAGARPLVILQPMGPVMFVFDVSDTEPLPGAACLPREVVAPFEITSGSIGDQLERTIENAKRDGVRVSAQSAGSQRAGKIGTANSSASQEVVARLAPQRETLDVPVRYEMLLSSSLSREARYATLVHELAHLYCGHLGTPNDFWWRDRRGLIEAVREFEAESVCYLVCGRAGIDNPSDKYLAAYLSKYQQVPDISLESVMAAAGLIEKMGSGRLKPRKAVPQKR
jgi:hypothetical protein